MSEVTVSVKSEGPAVAGKVVAELTYSYAPIKTRAVFVVLSSI